MERKNIKRNSTRKGTSQRPFIQGSGFGRKIWLPYSNLSQYERELLRKGLY